MSIILISIVSLTVIIIIGLKINWRRDPPPPAADDVRPLTNALRRNRNVFVFTGAGASADSGIPTFRGDKTSLWTGMLGPIILPVFGTPLGWKTAPKLCWFLYDKFLRRNTHRAKPNAFHRLVGDLHRQGKDVWVITQNVDGLHQKGGVPADRVVELHGTLWSSVCSKCHAELLQLDPAAFDSEHPPIEDVPRCQCGGYPRPGAVLFYDNFSPQEDFDLMRIMFNVDRDTTVIVCGLSGMVGSSDGLIGFAHSRAGAENAFVLNPRSTKYVEMDRYKINWIRGGAAAVAEIIRTN